MRKIDYSSIKLRLLLGLLTGAIVLTFFVAYMSFKVFERTLVYEIGNNRSDVLSQIGERVKVVKNHAYTLSNLYYYDFELQSLIRQMELSGQQLTQDNMNAYLDRMTAQYKKSLYEGDIDFNVILYTESGYGYSSVKEKEHYDYMNPKIKIWYRDMLQAKGDIIDVASYKDREREISYFCAARAIMDESGQPLAYLMVTINERQIYDMYAPVISGGGNIYIADRKGTIISSNDAHLNGFQYFNMRNLDKMFGELDYTITSMRSQKILFTRHEAADFGFTVLEEISLSSLLQPINEVRNVIVLIALCAVASVSIYVVRLTAKATKPLSQLCDFMQKVEAENMDQECFVSGYTEVNILSEKLNLMLGRMGNMMEDIKKKEQQKRKMELSFLQAQINPHFLYNTLFSVKCMVDMNRNEEASNMLIAFIQLLRNTLSNPDEFITLSQEIQLLKQYADIQRYRYDNNFEVFFECDEETADKKIPKLLIQPLLENAIFHGVELKKGAGIISITARIQKNNLMITVEDNGVGIPEEQLMRILQYEDTSKKVHVGVRNVKERVQLNFGEQYTMKIESKEWEGTKIILILPAIS